MNEPVTSGARDAALQSDAFQRWGLLAVVGAMLAALWIFFLGVALVQKQRLLDDASRELVQLNRAVAAQVGALLRAADTELRTMDLWLQSHPGIDPLADTRFIGLVNELRRSTGGLIDLRLASQDGRVYALPTLDGRPQAEAGTQAWFRTPMADRAGGLHIGDPVRARPGGPWWLPIARRLEVPAGRMVLGLADVSLERLFAVHDQLRHQPNGAIALLRADGVVLSRTPGDERFIGRSLAGTGGFQEEFGARSSGVFDAQGVLGDGIDRLASYQRLPDYPVIVVSAQSIDDVLGTFQYRRTWALAFLGLLTAVVLVFTGALYRSVSSLQAARREMQRLATSDGLTGVATRRAWVHVSERELARARRYRRPCAVLMLDLDHFKLINDTHGHGAGDEVLRECAGAWSRLLRSQDVLGRLGGEEFAVLLPETGSDSARLAAERMRAAVKALSFHGREGPFGVTVSIGFTELREGDNELTQLMERADRALYRAKQAGRDCVETDAGPRGQSNGPPITSQP